MLYLQSALILACALREVLGGLVAHLPGLAVAGVAEVVGAEAEIEGDGAAEAALVVDVLLLVLLAVGFPVVRPLQHVARAL